MNPKKRVVGKTGPELSSDEELMAQFSNVRNRKKKTKKKNKSSNVGAKQSNNHSLSLTPSSS
jgi:hypothetical protein